MFGVMLLCTGGGEFLMDGGTCMLDCECRVMHLVRRGLGYVLQGLAYVAFVLVDVQVSSQAAVETAGAYLGVHSCTKSLLARLRALLARCPRRSLHIGLSWALVRRLIVNLHSCGHWGPPRCFLLEFRCPRRSRGSQCVRRSSL